ncbi:MAG TPA: molybdenum cofactor biosynthesis protein MoaE [Gammaproteobacteria bacterium]|nr:molybdenum cofactor biosynthesis protein MoaE [Gammaproteobacteria bacterium]
MLSNLKVSIETSLIDVANCFAFLDNPSHGGIVTFLGVVRNNAGKTVIAVTYDVWEPYALSVFKKIGLAVQKKYCEDMKIFLSHYKGKLEVGGVSLALGVSTPHRHDAFLACREILEAIKVQAPIWKKEHYQEGGSDWLGGHSLCHTP